MKKSCLILFGLAGLLFGCQQPELLDPNQVGDQPMKTVTISTEVDGDDTKAAIDSETGQFSWQNGDVISVLATDGKFYDFTLTEGEGNYRAEFKGSIPEAAQITTVATYPSFVANGADNTILDGTTLNYVLPTEWTWERESSNVPMVAAFDEAAGYISFKQVGGVMRFPVKNMPAMGSLVITMSNTQFTGEFPIDITNLGEAAMVAGTAPATKADGFKDVVIEVLPDVYTETLTITYNSEVDGDLVEFNVPVPTGTYTNFYLQVKDDKGAVLFEKKYVKENKVERATLLNMSAIELPARNIAAPAVVWPYFVDARVVLPSVAEGETQYAVFVDGGEPVIKDIEMVNGKATVVCGGDFAHNSTHTVAIAKVANGVVLTSTKSPEVEFKTADVFQLTQNTGTKFVSVGWDDVAASWAPKYVNGKWTAVAKNTIPEYTYNGESLKIHQRRGYQVQLFAANDLVNPIYDLIPFDGHSAFTGPFSDSSWLGKVDGQNILIPTALSFGYLEPGQDYYFRVKTLDAPVVFNQTNGNYLPEGSTDQPYPYTLLSENGGSAWSELVKLSTDAAHVASANEILYEGFDDVQVANDYMNWAPGVVPDLDHTKRQAWDDYYKGAHQTNFPTFLQNPKSQTKWNAQAFSQTMRSYYLGLNPKHGSGNSTFNEDAGSLKDWTIVSEKDSRTVYPIFGAIRMGQSGSSGNGVSLYTPALNSDKLNGETGTKCIITVNASYSSTNIYHDDNRRYGAPVNVQLQRISEEGAEVGESVGLSASVQCPDEWNEWVVAHHPDENNYVHYQHYFELSCEMTLKNGERLSLTKIQNNDNKGMLVLGDVKIEVVAGDDDSAVFVDNGVGTEPDDTDYDVFGLGEIPISYWWTIPDYAHNFDDAKTRELYAEMAATGINVVLHNGEVNQSPAENKRIMNIAGELGMKFIGQVSLGGEDVYLSQQRIDAVREYLADSPYYLGEYIADEPSASKFDDLGQFTEDYLAAFPEKEVYINLFPYYASTQQIGTSTYSEHIEQYIAKVPTKSISYDYYGLNAEPQSLGSTYYTNLDLVRSKSLAVRKPFWMITQAGKVGKNTRMPSEKEERWNVWSMLAAGSKGVSYFCYWDPWSSEEDPDADVAMIHRDGEKTDRYYWIKQINSDIETIGKKLLPCHADGIMLTHPTYYPLYDNDGLGRTNYGPVKAVSGNTSIGLGCFRDARVSENGENYKGYKVMTVSQMPCRDAEAWLTLDPSVTEITVTHIHTSETLQVNNSLNATVGGITVSFDGTKLIVSMPEGEAALIEF